MPAASTHCSPVTAALSLLSWGSTCCGPSTTGTSRSCRSSCAFPCTSGRCAGFFRRCQLHRILQRFHLPVCLSWCQSHDACRAEVMAVLSAQAGQAQGAGGRVAPQADARPRGGRPPAASDAEAAPEHSAGAAGSAGQPSARRAVQLQVGLAGRCHA
jgi:hypothetical protein